MQLCVSIFIIKSPSAKLEIMVVQTEICNRTSIQHQQCIISHLKLIALILVLLVLCPLARLFCSLGLVL